MSTKRNTILISLSSVVALVGMGLLTWQRSPPTQFQASTSAVAVKSPVPILTSTSVPTSVSKRPENAANTNVPESRAADLWPDTAGLTQEQLSDEVGEHEARLEREDAIARLNRGEVTQDEREEYGRLFARLVDLKRVLLEREVAQANAQLEFLTSTHASRLAAAGIVTLTPNEKE